MRAKYRIALLVDGFPNSLSAEFDDPASASRIYRTLSETEGIRTRLKLYRGEVEIDSLQLLEEGDSQINPFLKGY